MSRGEYMKFQTAYAMAHHPVLYLLDEVTAGMDPVFRIDYFKLLQSLIEEENASVLMISHIQEEMERKMDYLGIMEEGRLVSWKENL
jgi:ABC-2 type transport system ATP-binding protein